MCHVCCKEFRQWCKSFTWLETLLAVLEAMLLIALIGFMIFLILHLIACTPRVDVPKDFDMNTEVPHLTLPPHMNCTWKPSKKTTVYPHYTTNTETTSAEITTADSDDYFIIPIIKDQTPDYEYLWLESSDGETADHIYRHHFLALVKLSPRREFTFGCILSVISQYWTLTAASCIEAIEEMDSLDTFFMLEGYGEVRAGRSHGIEDVAIHPLFQGGNWSHDLAALRSEDPLVRAARMPLRLPSMIDYFLITIGERFIALGYGSYRAVEEPHGSDRRLQQASVFSMPGRQCAAQGQGEGEGQTDGDGAWAPRHLVPLSAAPHRPCGAAPLCAGALWRRGTPCNHCAGTPLLSAADRDTAPRRQRPAAPLLVGVMSRSAQCGAACEPQRYVNLAAHADWLDSLLEPL